MWDALRLDVRHSYLSLRRAPAFSLIVVATLAVAVGATTAVGSLLHALFARKLPRASRIAPAEALREEYDPDCDALECLVRGLAPTPLAMKISDRARFAALIFVELACWRQQTCSK